VIDRLQAKMRNIMSAEENKKIIRRLYEETNKGNLAAMDEFFAPNIVDHNPPPILGLASGLEGIKQAFTIFYNATPDGYHIIEDMIAEGDKVVVRVTARGTHKGELFGLPPTGKRLTMTGIAIYRIAGGKIVERWSEQDKLGIMQQLGVIQLSEQSKD
jgi:predicted ester cyclase